MKLFLSFSLLFLLCSCTESQNIQNGEIAVKTNKGKFLESFTGPTTEKVGFLEHLYIFKSHETITIVLQPDQSIKVSLEVTDPAKFYEFAQCRYDILIRHLERKTMNMTVSEAEIYIINELNNNDLGLYVSPSNKRVNSD